MLFKPLNITIGDRIRVACDGLPPMMDRKLHEKLVFANPDYELRHNRGEWIGSIPAQISCLKQKGRSYLLPRGFIDQFTDLCKRFQLPYKISDHRRSFDPIPLEFHGELKSYQQDAAETVLERDFGTLVGGHKSGKTVIALYTVAQRRQPTLILIPKIDLLDGWLTKIENFLQIPREEIGIVSNGVYRIGERITIAHTGELSRLRRKIWEQVGYLIVDECQKCPTRVFSQLIPNFDSRYMLGLSNASRPKDHLSRLVGYYVGEVVYSIDEKDAREGRGVIQGRIVARRTDFNYPYRSREDYAPMLQALMEDAGRTSAIADDIEAELREGKNTVLVLSGGEEQNRALGEELTKRRIPVCAYGITTGSVSGDEDASGECPEFRLPNGTKTVLLTQDALQRCGKRLTAGALFLAVPVYFRRRLAAAVEELHSNRESPENGFKVYDYIDHRIGILDNYFRMRSYSYGVHPDVLLNSGSD